ncbi:MAG: CHAT domain-containing protein [Cytophagales bacterium]|nr:CHAT domain-containing protein [Cytophagales bacterium]
MYRNNWLFAILFILSGLFVEAMPLRTATDSLINGSLDIVLQVEELIKTGQLSNARSLLTSTTIEEYEHPIDPIQFNYLTGLLHYHEGKYQLAIPLLRAAIYDHPTDIYEEKWNLRPLEVMGHVYYYQSQLDSSIHYSLRYLQSLEYFKDQDPLTWSDLWKKAVYSMGHLYVERGNYQAALEQYKLWAEIASIGAEKNLALTYRGRVLIEIGATHQGLGLLQKAIDSIDAPLYPIQYALQAEAYLKINQLDLADLHIQQLFDLLAEYPTNSWIMATAEFTKGCILYKRKEYEKSIDFFRRSIKKLAHHDPNSQMIIQGYTQWYNSLIETHQFEEAEALSKALSSNPRQKSSAHWLRYELATAKRAMYIGKQAEAQEILQDILDRNTRELANGYVRHIDPWLQAQARMNLIALNQKAEIEPSDSTFNQYLEVDEAINELRMTYLSYADQIGLSDTIHGMYQEAIDYGFQLYANDPDQDLLNDITWLIERSKSISLYHQLDLKGRQSQFVDQSKINQELNHYYGQLFGKKEQQTLLQDTLVKLEEAKNRFTQEENFGLSIGKPILHQLSEKLDKDQTLISYYFGKKYLYRLILNQQNQDIQSLGPVTIIQKAIQTFNQQLSLRDFSKEGVSDFSESGNSLYQLLFDAISSEQLTKHLTIIPDGPLFQVPFELLTTETSGENYRSLPYLLKNHVINYSQSLSLLDHFNDIKKTASPHVMAVAPSQFETTEQLMTSMPSVSRDFGPLAHNQEEVEYVQELFGGIVLKSEAATESAFRSNFKPNAILHLATHAYNDRVTPDNSFIFFQNDKRDSLNDGKLYAWEVTQLELTSPMVVLSACNTGLGKTYLGEGPQSLASSFFRAGARSVLMSLWKANDLTTANLMQQFYSHLKTGKTKDVSLRKAKLDFLENCDELYVHPAFWGGFIVVGDTRSIDQDRNYNWWLLLIIPTLVTLWLLRKKRTYR